MSGDTKYKFINAVLFQVGWFSCILLPVKYSVPIASAVLTAHYFLSGKSDKEMLKIFAIGSIGYCMDVVCQSMGLINLSASNSPVIYLVLVWLLFASTLNWSMKFFMLSPLRSAVLGLLAPMSYFAAQQLNKVQYSEPLVKSMLIHALLWSVLMLIVQKVFFDQNSQCINER